jgi:cytochrome c-type biogenesis protein
MADVNFLVAFAAGIFSFLSPCVLPLIPSYLSFVSGVSLEEMRSDQALRRVRSRVVLNSVAFILGFSLVFVSLGASASYLGSFFLGYRSFIRLSGGLLFFSWDSISSGFQNSALERYLQFNLKDKPAGYRARFWWVSPLLWPDPLCRTDPGSHSRAGRNFGKSVGASCCSRPMPQAGLAVFPERAGG